MASIANPSGGSFEQYTAEIYGWAYRLLGRHHDALDVVQDVFLRWDAQCAKETPRQPRGWLRRVTLNRAIDLRRRRRTPPVPQASAGAEPVEPEAVPAPSGSGSSGVAASLDQEVLREDVAAALDELSDVQRSVLVGKVYDELTFNELAAELGLAPSTVKTHYLRAVTGVRDRLSPRWA